MLSIVAEPLSVNEDTQDRYIEDMKYLKSLIPKDELIFVCSQRYCEFDRDFLGFISEYRSVSEFLPKDMTVIDLGCYLAAQSYFFTQFSEYIGVDIVGESNPVFPLKRFSAKNATHYEMSIKDFLKNVAPSILTENKNEKVAVVMNYVPDFTVTDEVLKTFKNVFINYPGKPLQVSGIFKEM